MSRLDFLYRTELPHRAVAVYIYLADRTNENNECWPAIPTIAADLKYSPSTVRRGIHDLKKSRTSRNRAAVSQKRRQEQSAVPAESGVKKAKRSAKGQLRLQADRCHLSWWKVKVNYPTEDRLQQKEKDTEASG